METLAALFCMELKHSVKSPESKKKVKNIVLHIFNVIKETFAEDPDFK
jgi:hypothetical protein